MNRDELALLLMELDEALAQAEWVVNRFFPDPLLQHTYDLSKTLDDLFGKKG